MLAVGILHQIFDASNNNGALVDSVLDGVDAGNMTQLAAVVLTVLIRGVAALATSWRIRQTSDTASRFTSGGWVAMAGAVVAEAAGRLAGLLRCAELL